MLLEAGPTGMFDPPGLLVFFRSGRCELLLDAEWGGSDDLSPGLRRHPTVERLRAAGVPIVSEPHVIFPHTDDRLGPAGTDEWMAFFTDSEGNTVGLVSHAPS